MCIVIEQIQKLFGEQIADCTAAKSYQKAAADNHGEQAPGVVVIASGIRIRKGWQQKITQGYRDKAWHRDDG